MPELVNMSVAARRNIRVLGVEVFLKLNQSHRFPGFFLEITTEFARLKLGVTTIVSVKPIIKLRAPTITVSVNMRWTVAPAENPSR